MLEWYAVGEELPDDDELVIAAMWLPEYGDHCFWIASFVDGVWFERGDEMTAGLEDNCGFPITHWAYINDPPAPEQETVDPVREPKIVRCPYCDVPVIVTGDAVGMNYYWCEGCKKAVDPVREPSPPQEEKPL